LQRGVAQDLCDSKGIGSRIGQPGASSVPQVMKLEVGDPGITTVAGVSDYYNYPSEGGITQ
jgi:hypothetical protein